MGHNRQKHSIVLPHLGQRIIKTGIAVFICLVIYWLRGFQGLVVQSTVAAIICIQPNKADTIQTSVNRVIGTLIGAAWAVLFLLMLVFLSKKGIHPHVLPVYLVMTLGIIVTLYSTVVLKKTDAASLAAIVFICIVAVYPDYESPFEMTMNRIIDTIIGIVVAGCVNSVTLPRRKHKEYLFFLRLQDLVPDRYSRASSNVLVILNRLVEEGANICLVSKWAPAFMISQMGVMNINIPVIVMDGAALYDIPNHRYLNVIPMKYNDVDFLRKFFRELGLSYAAYEVRDSSLMIYRGGKINEEEKEEYERMKYSPYRNYVEGDFGPENHICFIRVIDKDEIIEELEQRFHGMLSKDRFRIVKRPQPRLEGCSGLYFYNTEATVEGCKEALIRHLEEEDRRKIEPIDMSGSGQYISENESIALLNKVRQIYEPVKMPWGEI